MGCPVRTASQKPITARSARDMADGTMSSTGRGVNVAGLNRIPRELPLCLPRIMKWSVQPLLLITTVSLLSGCLSARPLASNASPAVSSVQIASSDLDAVWERTIAVLNDHHFQVARESKLEGVIETHYRAGSNLLEPWNPDSIGLENRMESTLHSIRRKVFVTFVTTSPGMVTVSVRADREIEDVPGLTATYEGGATFREAEPLDRDLTQTLGQSAPSRWLYRGTDPALEGRIMSHIRFGMLR